ncbi:T-cell surface protein tactile [Pseudoliparis swirei]|uniref:T-cell surface protein tactile n=1 Tax=Pseudoliparis swirei TaxID=2059687 RepID=UPI0024BD5E1A|nr:T-cell surface protein tactile [Pseudoliparis swirei]
MIPGSSDVAAAALGTAFSLLLCASIIQGRQEAEGLKFERMEAVAGQNVTLPCTIKKIPDLKIVNIVSIEWRKNKPQGTKLALYSPGKELVLFWPNITMQVNNTSLSSLQLYGVTTQDSGIYICDIASYPQGSFRRRIQLEIKDDVDIKCDAESAVEVHSGGNVTITCRTMIPDAKYTWTKNKALVSDNESLELRCVSEAHTGVYTLTVSSTGNARLQKEFTVTVRTATTSFSRDLVTVPAQSNVTEEGLATSQSNVTEEGLATSPTNGLSTTDAYVTRTVNMSAAVTDENPNAINVTAEDPMTSFTNTHVSVAPSPLTHTDPYRLNNSDEREIRPTRDSNTVPLSDQSVAFNLSTTLSYGHEVFRSTYETTNESMGGNPAAPPTLSSGNTTVVIEDEGTGGARRLLLLLSLIMVPILVSITTAGVLYSGRRKKRMDRPPPFKPPPPPVKYTAARHQEISTRYSRCNSVTEPLEMKHMCVNV